MSDKKADKPRYWLTYLLKDLAVGKTFKADVLHFTIVPWFVTELPEEQVIKTFLRAFSSQKKFAIIVGGKDVFKNKRQISISLIEPSSEVQSLHQQALVWLDEINARWAVKNPYVGAEFIPHIRRRRGRNVSEGQAINLSSLSLVRAYRRGDDSRTVAAKVIFDESR